MLPNANAAQGQTAHFQQLEKHGIYQ